MGKKKYWITHKKSHVQKSISSDSNYYLLIDGNIYLKNTNIENWIKIPNPLPAQTIDIACINKGDNTLLYATSGTNLYYTGNNGSDWFTVSSETYNVILCENIGITGNKIIILNDDIISKSYRKKISWATDTIGLQNSKNLNLKVYGDTLIVHNNLEIFYKTEMMQSWTKIKANFLICISKVVLYNNGLYVQNCDRIYRTENLGKPGIH